MLFGVPWDIVWGAVGLRRIMFWVRRIFFGVPWDTVESYLGYIRQRACDCSAVGYCLEHRRIFV